MFDHCGTVGADDGAEVVRRSPGTGHGSPSRIPAGRQSGRGPRSSRGCTAVDGACAMSETLVDVVHSHTILNGNTTYPIPWID